MKPLRHEDSQIEAVPSKDTLNLIMNPNMDSKSVIDTTSQAQVDESSGIAFTSANPLEGFSYSAARDSSDFAIKSNSLPSEKEQASSVTAGACPSTGMLQHFRSPPITLIVGGALSPSTELQPIAFYVHADLLISVSSFFRAAFGTKTSSTCSNTAWCFTESQTRAMRLPEERPEDIAYLLQWIYWRGLHKNVLQKSQGSGILPAGGLWHEDIDPRVQRYQEYVEAKRLLKRALGQSEHTAKPLQRPNPPAFGPLIRLYVLADKFDVVELKSEICRRVREVGREAKCVPGREDVEGLWRAMVVEVGVGAEGADRGLKHEVVEMFAGLGAKSWRKLFRAEEVEEERSEGEETVVEWEQSFLADLVLRLFARCEILKGGRRGKGSGCRREGFEKESQQRGDGAGNGNGNRNGDEMVDGYEGSAIG